MINQDFSLSSILSTRKSYFKMISQDFRNYNPDINNILTSLLPKIGVLNPSLNEAICLLYEKALSNHPITEVKDYEIFDEMSRKLTQYVKTKKHNADQELLVHLDIWTKALVHAKDEKEARNLLNASDQIEDLLWLAEFVATHQLSEEEIKFGSALDKVIVLIPNFFEHIPSYEALKSPISDLLKGIKYYYLSSQFDEALAEIERLKRLINPIKQ